MLPTRAVRHTTMEGIRAVLFEECGGWIGQCLEQDIATQADTMEGVAISLERHTKAYDEIGAERPGPAPKMFFDLWEASK